MKGTREKPWIKKMKCLCSKPPAADGVFLKSVLTDQRMETHLSSKK